MTNPNAITEAAERLRRLKRGETLTVVYGKPDNSRKSTMEAVTLRTHDALLVANAYLDSLATPQPPSRLKPLVWDETMGLNRCFIAITPWGEYLADDVSWMRPEDSDARQCNGSDEAKQLCQRDYESRVAALFEDA